MVKLESILSKENLSSIWEYELNSLVLLRTNLIRPKTSSF